MREFGGTCESGQQGDQQIDHQKVSKKKFNQKQSFFSTEGFRGASDFGSRGGVIFPGASVRITLWPRPLCCPALCVFVVTTRLPCRLEKRFWILWDALG